MIMSLVLDDHDAFHARVARRLSEETVVWLTTVTPSGAPSPNPVWFLWDGAAGVRVFNAPTAARLAHVAANPAVTLHFDSDGTGGDIVVLRGTAVVEPEAAGPHEVPDYLEKYREHIPAIGHSVESFAEAYGVPLLVTLDRVRGF